MNNKIKGLTVEIGTQKYELPEIRSDLIGKGLKEMVRYVTNQRVDTLYIKGLDQFVDDQKTLKEMKIADRDVFIGACYEYYLNNNNNDYFDEIDLNNNNNNNNNLNNNNNNNRNNRRRSWRNLWLNNNNNNSDDSDDDVEENEEEEEEEEEFEVEIDNSPLYSLREERITKYFQKLRSDNPYHFVNLFHIISIICCLLSLFIYFSELIPCFLSFLVFDAPIHYVPFTRYSRSLLWADILVTFVVFFIFLVIIISLIVHISHTFAVLLICLIPYLYVISACFVSIECDFFH